LERGLHELRGVKAEIEELKTGMVKMHTAAVQRDEYVDKEMDKHHKRLACHRHDLETMRARISVLEERTSRSVR